MKFGGATLMRCFLVGVMPLIGTSMKTMKEIGQALSMDGSFFDHGLGGDDLNLQVIESSLMSMVREGTSPSLRPGIEAIMNLTNDMKAAVENKSNQEQMNLTYDWYEWLNCTLSNADRRSFLDDYGQVRHYCWDRGRDGLYDWEGNIYNGTADDWWNTICRENNTQTCLYENEIAAQSCPHSPFACEKQWAAFDDNTDVRAHMAYLQSVFAQGMTLVTNCSTAVNCTWQNRTDCPGVYNFSSQNCSEAVCRFENEGCKLQRDACSAYETCYYQRWQDYNQTKDFTLAQESANKEEYRAILRIECLLKKFLASIDNNQSLSVGIESCINTTFYVNDTTFFGDVTIHYYNESENPLKACTAENFPNFAPSFNVPPGSTAWQYEYYLPYMKAGLEPPVCIGDPSLAALVPDCVLTVR